ncbi:MAG: M15 family metallopeptidase [Clostridiales bacterium]|nr:M15 family metallopeptidase [Clostridiales bacterium]
MSRKYKVRYDRIIAVSAIFILIIILIATALNKAASGKKDKNKKTPSSSPSITSETNSSSSVATVEKVIKNNSDIKTGNLILVNSANPYTKPAAPTATVIKDYPAERHYYVVDNEVSLNTDALIALNQFMDGYYSVNNSEDIRIIDAYRNSLTDVTSEIITGLSFNIGIRIDANSSAQYTPTDKYAWVTENCHKYGFIERYPEGKSDITGHDASYSHFRYVGVPHAVYMKENNLCLEEYIELVKGYDFITGRLKITVGEKKYEVYYVPQNTANDTTEIHIEPNKNYTISGNNIDGFIVTVEV